MTLIEVTNELIDREIHAKSKAPGILGCGSLGYHPAEKLHMKSAKLCIDLQLPLRDDKVITAHEACRTSAASFMSVP